MDDLARWMGWKPYLRGWWQWIDAHKEFHMQKEWEPEHNIADAWLLIDRARELGWWTDLNSFGNCKAWTCEMGQVGNVNTIWVLADTAPAAICAAVRAIIAQQADG